MVGRPSDWEQLRGRIRGTVLLPGEPGYDTGRRVWNSMVDRHPAAVVQVGTSSDVPTVVRFAQDVGLELAVRGGGHSVAGRGTVEAGLVLDLGALTGVRVDAGRSVVEVAGGARLCHVDVASMAHGLAVPLGVVSQTGVAGLTLGGGLGWLTRKHGLSADNVIGAEVVTAAGEVVTADAEHDPELLWALRGGGGNFGVVTRFTFQAHDLPSRPCTATFTYRRRSWSRAWRAFRAWTADLPDELTAITTTLNPWPELDMGSEPVLLVACAWASPDQARFAELMGRLRSMCPPDTEQVGPLDWVVWQSAFDTAMPRGVRSYWRNTSLDDIDEAVIDVLVERGGDAEIGMVFDVHHLGGHFAELGSADSPFPGRRAPYWVNIYSFWRDPAQDPEMIDFVRGMSSALEPLGSGAQYLNFQGEEAEGHRLLDARTVFGDEVFDQLAAVKRRLDPDNVFHVNLNVPPA